MSVQSGYDIWLRPVTAGYWDWSLDWQDPYNSPIFDPENGFGGEGSKLVEGFRGSCLDAGPLPNYRVLYIEPFFWPHCLSRDYLKDQTSVPEWAGKWNPEYIETLFEETDLDSFALKIETGPHRALPRMLHGYFSTRNAPIDSACYTIREIVIAHPQIFSVHTLSTQILSVVPYISATIASSLRQALKALFVGLPTRLF